MKQRTKLICVAAAVATMLPCSSANALWWGTYGTWDSQTRKDAADAALLAVVTRFNNYGDFNAGSDGWVDVYYDAGVPTANASWGGAMTFGGTWPGERVAQHEMNHWLGSIYGHNPNSTRGIERLEQFDGVGARFGNDSSHFWPYGLNYDSEWSEVAGQRNVAIMYAFRGDWGIGSIANPAAWAATSVTLTGSDAAGESGFNYANKWSDANLAHPNADYSTSTYSIRTPGGYPSWNFAGKSLTVNSGGSMLFNGWGTAGVVTVKNLTLSGGTVKHDQFQQDVFQLAGNVNLSATSTFNTANGHIKVLAPVSGAGGLTKTGAYTLTMTGNGTYSGDTTISAGTLRLAPVAPVASYSFDNVSGSTVMNGGSGGTGMNGMLTGGAAIVGGGQSGNAVSLAGGASVNINSSISDLHNQGNWSVTAWVKTGTAGSTIFSKGDGSTWASGNTIFYLGDGTAGGSGGIPSSVRYGGGFFQGSTGATAVNNNAWHQVTYVNSGGTYAIYVDGNSQPLSSGNSGFGNTDAGSVVRLGATSNTSAGDGTVNFNGLMDNVQFYNQGLSGSQVTSLYQGGNISGTLPSTTNVTIASSAVLDVNGANQTIGSLTGASGSAVRLGSGKLTVASANSSTFSGTINGAGGSLVKSGSGVLTLGGANTYGGTTTINGGTLRLSNPAGVAAATPIASYSFANVAGSTVINGGSGGALMNGTLNVNGGTGSINIGAGPGTGMGALVLNGNGTTVDINSGVTDLSSNSTWSVSAWIKTTQAGATILNKGNGTGWNSGYSTFYLGNGNDAGSGGLPDAVRWGGGWLAGSTAVNDGNWHLLTYTGAAGVKTVYVDGVAETLSQNQFNNTDTGAKIRIGFAPTNSDGELPTNGSLSGINIYNSALSAAQVASLYSTVVGNTPLPAGTPVTIASGATLDVNGVNQTIASLSGVAGAGVMLGAGVLTTGDSTSTTFAGVISGNGNLNKQRTGTFTLSGANTYVGSTNVLGGTLTLDAAGSLASTGLSTASGTTLNVNGSLSGAPGINSSGAVNIAGNASTSVNGARSVGSVVINAGGQVTVLSSAVAGKPMVLSAAGLSFGDATATFDLTNNELIVMSSLASIRSSIVAGSLKTSTAGLVVGSMDLANGTIEARATLSGDTNLDGTVDVTDLGNLASNYGTGSTAVWVQGDTNYDDKVDVTDLGNLATSYGGSLAGGPSLEGSAMSADATASVAAVPEPGSFAVVGVAVCALSTRRMRRRRFSA